MTIKEAGAQLLPLRVGVMVGWRMAHFSITEAVDGIDAMIAEIGPGNAALKAKMMENCDVARGIALAISNRFDELDAEYGLSYDEVKAVVGVVDLMREFNREQRDGRGA